MTKTKTDKQTRDRLVRFKIWAQIRDLRRFTAKDLTSGNLSRAQRFVNALIDRGFVTVVEPEVVGVSPALYELTKDPGQICPALTQQEQNRAKFWQAIRVIQHSFSIQQIASTVEGEEQKLYDDCKQYMRALTNAGILKLKAIREPGLRGRYNRYTLIKDLGPQPPIAQRSKPMVFDPNSNQYLGGQDD